MKVLIMFCGERVSRNLSVLEAVFEIASFYRELVYIN